MNSNYYTVDIIIPFFERADFLATLLSGIQTNYFHYKSQLFLTVIVVNDSPWKQEELDGLVAAQQWNFNLKVIPQEANKGVAISRELGLLNSSGEWVMLLDQDDELVPEFFQTLLTGITKQVDFILMNGYLIHHNPSLKFPIYYLPQSLDLASLLKFDFIRSPGQVFFKRKLVQPFSFPKPNFNKGCDDRFLWILIFLCNKNLKAWYSKDKHYIGHIHGANFGLDSANLYACSLELWHELEKFDFGEFAYLVENNKMLILHILKKERSLKSYLLFVQYKFELNKLIRFFIKNCSRFVKIYK